jgi:putative endonuclease
MAYYMYILASRKDGAIYIGVTNDIVRRVYEHRIKAVPGFTSNTISHGWFGSKYAMIPPRQISREKELKKWKRSWKVQLIEAQNPDWKDLYESICN